MDPAQTMKGDHLFSLSGWFASARAPRRFVIRPLLIALALAIGWLFAGRQLTLLLDRFVTIGAASLPISPREYDGGGFLIGQLQMTFGSIDNRRFDLVLRSDSTNRVVLSSGGHSFILGPRTNPVDPSGRPEIDFVPEPGDELSFTATGSVLAWPTPFEFNIMIPHSPWWKRYVYYRLLWKKRSGARLEMGWRYEQDYYAAGGWTRPAMMWNSQTGLLRVDISSATTERR
jgi:hypothetical protein